MARFIVVKNWDRFQHYKDRDPPWIKFYRDTLTSEVWVLGTDTSRLLQIASTLLAARYSNRIPLNFGLIRKVASIDCTIDEFNAAIDHLVSQEFIEIQGVDDPPRHDASALLATCTSEAEQSRGRAEGEAEQKHLSPSSTEIVERGTSGDGHAESAVRIFAHWKLEHVHPKAVLDGKRRKLIRDRLKDGYSEADLCRSISGFLNSPHHMGQNDKSTKYDDLELMLRDSKHVDMGLRFFDQPPPTNLSASTQRLVRQTEDWVPPELRRAN